MQEIEQRATGLELHQKIDVATRQILTSSRRTKQGDRQTPVGMSQLGDLGPVTFDKCATRPHDSQATRSPLPNGEPMSSQQGAPQKERAGINHHRVETDCSRTRRMVPGHEPTINHQRMLR